jgi:hypothetical protein
MRRSVMPVKADNQEHRRKTGPPVRTARSACRGTVALDRALLDLVAVVACAITLVTCAALGDGAGIASAATALGVVLKLRDSSEGKPL